MAMKDYIVTFDTSGEVQTVKDITNPATPPRVRILTVRAKNHAKAVEAAKALYSLAK